MEYFGTDLKEYGHYFWLLYNDKMVKSGVTMSDIPFYPYDMPNHSKDNPMKVGEYRYYQSGTYTIFAIKGSCKDTRGGTVTVFFIDELLSEIEMIERLRNIPIAMKIVTNLPVIMDCFDTVWIKKKVVSHESPIYAKPGDLVKNKHGEYHILTNNDSNEYAKTCSRYDILILDDKTSGANDSNYEGKTVIASSNKLLDVHKLPDGFLERHVSMLNKNMGIYDVHVAYVDTLQGLEDESSTTANKLILRLIDNKIITWINV